MFALRVLPSIKLLSTNKFLFIRHSGTEETRPWNYLWQPGPFPKTDAQRVLAAKKYGLHPSEYEPVEDLGMGHGDYPAMPNICMAVKDPFYPYDFPALKRNFNETLHDDFELISDDRYDYNVRDRIGHVMRWMQFLAAISFFSILMFYGEKYIVFHGIVPKQYPGKGKIHYAFESNIVPTE